MGVVLREFCDGLLPPSRWKGSPTRQVRSLVRVEERASAGVRPVFVRKWVILTATVLRASDATGGRPMAVAPTPADSVPPTRSSKVCSDGTHLGRRRALESLLCWNRRMVRAMAATFVTPPTPQSWKVSSCFSGPGTFKIVCSCVVSALSSLGCDHLTIEHVSVVDSSSHCQKLLAEVAPCAPVFGDVLELLPDDLRDWSLSEPRSVEDLQERFMSGLFLPNAVALCKRTGRPARFEVVVLVPTLAKWVGGPVLGVAQWCFSLHGFC